MGEKRERLAAPGQDVSRVGLEAKLAEREQVQHAVLPEGKRRCARMS